MRSVAIAITAIIFAAQLTAVSTSFNFCGLLPALPWCRTAASV